MSAARRRCAGCDTLLPAAALDDGRCSSCVQQLELFDPQPGIDAAALEFAGKLIDAGVPIFLARPGGPVKGFWLGKGWETTSPKRRLLEAYEPGMAVCMVTGHGRDVVDLDPRNFKDQDEQGRPRPPAELADCGLGDAGLGVVRTPSGGHHYPVVGLGVRKCNDVLPGVDILAGDPDGNGRAFAFLPPTVGYVWVRPPALARPGEQPNPRLVALARNGSDPAVAPATSTGTGADDAGPIPAGSRDDTITKYAARIAGLGLPRSESEALLKAAWARCEQPAGDEFTWSTALAKLDTAWAKFHDSERVPRTPLDPPAEAPEVTLTECREVFRRWFGAEYDLAVLDAMLCTLAAERLDGDPLWLLVISGPGAAKTETVSAAAGAGALVTSTISSDAALLSGSPKRERAKDATGGLLRKIGDSGVLVVKDVTSILSANRDLRATVLAALREVHDGYWQRNLGVDGGRSLTWRGRIVVIGAVTTAWDAAHTVVATMGDRFVSVRLDSGAAAGRVSAGRRTMANTGDETHMRTELRNAVAGVLAGVDLDVDLSLTAGEVERLLAAANLVTLARTAVEFDYRGDVIDAHAPEMPTRFLRQLQQVVRGGLALGMDRERCLRLAIRCARDSMPPVRLLIVDDLAKHPHSTPSDIRRRLDLPWTTVDRQCQALHMLRVVDCDEIPYGESGKSRWYYTLAKHVDAHALEPPNPEWVEPSPDLSISTGRPSGSALPGAPTPGRGSDIAGEDGTPGEVGECTCVTPVARPDGHGGWVCRECAHPVPTSSTPTGETSSTPTGETSSTPTGETSSTCECGAEVRAGRRLCRECAAARYIDLHQPNREGSRTR